MKPIILVADDVGACANELSRIFEGRGVELARATSLEDCVEKARSQVVTVMMIYVGMSRAFSLLRILRRSDDLAAIPLVVIGEPEQEELIAKHRKLPSRADRYMLRPLDPELARSVAGEFIDGTMEADLMEDDEVTPPPLPGTAATEVLGQAPDAFVRMEEELRAYQERIKKLEQDLGDLAKVSTENAALQRETEVLRMRYRETVTELEKTKSPKEMPAEYDELFQRLESGYKDTIDDLERLIQEKDEIIARLAATDDGDGEELSALTEQLEVEQARSRELIKLLRQVAAKVNQEGQLIAEFNVSGLLEDLRVQNEESSDLSASLSFDEKTLIVDAEELQRQMDD
jgi:CheY-like chemotaxis protein